MTSPLTLKLGGIVIAIKHVRTISNATHIYTIHLTEGVTIKGMEFKKQQQDQPEPSLLENLLVSTSRKSCLKKLPIEIGYTSCCNHVDQCLHLLLKEATSSRCEHSKSLLDAACHEGTYPQLQNASKKEQHSPPLATCSARLPQCRIQYVSTIGGLKYNDCSVAFKSIQLLHPHTKQVSTIIKRARFHSPGQLCRM